MSISVVTVALNAAKDLPLTIESVLGQEGADIEYIVVDGGSWDETGALLNRYEDDLDAVVRIEHASIYHAMNEAVASCNKDYVLFLNAGDRLFARDTLKQMLGRVDGRPDIFFGDHIYVNGRLEIFKRAATFEQTAADLRAGRLTQKWHSQIPGHQATFTARALLCEQRYDTRYRICADHDFLLRAYDRGARFQYIDEVVAHYIGGGFSAANEDLCRREWNLAYRRFSDKPRAVDAFFFPDGSSPFQLFTDRTGARLRGFFLPEGPFPDLGVPWRISWCSGAGFALRTPRYAATRRVALAGYNMLAGQRLEAFCGDEYLGVAEIGMGAFETELVFGKAAPADAEVYFVPQRFLKHPAPDGRTVSVALAFSEFQP